MKKIKINTRNKKIALIAAAALVLAFGGLLIYRRNTTNNNAMAEDKTTSTAPSAQSDFTEGGDRPIAPSTDKGSADITDNQGAQSDIPDKSLWSTSSTGEVTVYAPAKNKLIINGEILSGASTLPVVYYRVIDDVSGMIAQGQLSVVNGKFSGSVSFTTSATNGRIDVYGATDSGKELGNVEVPVRFK